MTTENTRCPGLDLGCEYISEAQIAHRCETEKYRGCPSFRFLDLPKDSTARVEIPCEGIGLLL